MKIALVHDFLTQNGGAEKVLQAFKKAYPEAPIYVLFADKNKFAPTFNPTDIRESFLAKMPFILSKYRYYLSMMPSAIESLNLNDFDVVLSSVSAFAKGVITKPETVHVSYCHTPTRYLWSDSHEYVENLKMPGFMKRLLELQLNKLRVWDKLAAERVDYFVANSHIVKDRIAKYYNRPSSVIYPPVETAKFYITDKPGSYYLAGGRLVPYKRFDLIVDAFNRLALPLVIYGDGPEYENLRRRAKSNIKFVIGQLNDADLTRLYSESIAYIQPQIEDFGITAVESMASGRPVIAYAKGGSLETVKEGVSGTFFKHQDWASLVDAVMRFKPEDYDPKIIKQYAERFSLENFKTQITNFVNEKHQQKKDAIVNQQIQMNL
jgi:glycosyltransferase involved in cell wall biosynthesis